MIGEAYRKLEDRFRRIGALRDAEAMLHWDLATMMPKGGAQARGEQLAVLKALRHGLLIASEIGDWLGEAEAMRIARRLADAPTSARCGGSGRTPRR